MQYITEIRNFFFLYLFLFIMNTSYAQWSDPIRISQNNNFGILSNNMTISGEKVLFTWDKTKDVTFMNTEIYFRELKNGILSGITTVSGYGKGASNPVILADDKRYFLMWGERHTEPKGPLIQTPSALLYSVSADTGWSKPSIFFDNKGLQERYAIKMDQNKDIHAIWSSNDSMGFSLRYIKNHENNWIESKKIPFNGIYPDFIFRNGNISMSYIDIISTGGGDANSLFYSTSSDSMRKWSKPVLVHKSGGYPSYEPRIIMDGKGIKHITWRKDNNMDNWSESVYHSYSIDGIKWSLPECILDHKSGVNYYLNVVCDSKNNLHAVWMHSADFREYNLFYSKYDGKQWTKPGILFSNAEIPCLCIDSIDRLHLSFRTMSTTPGDSAFLVYSYTPEPVTGILQKSDIPEKFTLEQNYPNPFNPTTVISFYIEMQNFAPVQLKIYDILGREVKSLINEYRAPGKHSIVFDAKGLAGGIYFYKLISNNHTEVRKMVCLK